ncbi:MAG: galactofuranose transport system permease protein [Verrucomicrobiota bacterium]|nr:galactofuranose transport system permease protein [Verrucomicrobiota bacterium]
MSDWISDLLFWVFFGLILFSLRRQRMFWTVGALALLLLFNQFFTPGFFHIQLLNGHFYGSRIDVLNQGAKVMLLSLGMVLVIATGGVDLSVGAVMAISAAVSSRLLVTEHQPAGVAIAAALVISVLAGAWNGLLVAGLGIQPIIATLVLMVAGRGVAQLITEGQIINFLDPTMVYLGNGHLFALPFTLTLVVVMLLLTLFLVRRTALGLFIESVGDNYEASRYSGINARQVKFLVYTFSGLCAGLAGLVACSNIKSADANNIGLYLELDAILAVVVGGTSLQGGRFYLVGAVVGALFIQTLTTTLYARNVSSDVSPVPKALVIIAVCLFQSDVFRARAARFCQPLLKFLKPLSSRLPH